MIEKEKIIPAVLPKNWKDIENFCSRFKNETEKIQIDICDGKYVDSLTWPLTDMSYESFKNIGEEFADVTFPYWEDLDVEVDMMVNNPQRIYRSFIQYGAERLIFHFGSLKSVDEVELVKMLESCRDLNVSLSLAVTVGDDMSNFKSFLHKNIDFFDRVQIMGIGKIGIQGQDFSLKTLDIIGDIKNEFGNLEISIDGGMNAETARKVFAKGADFVVVGSYFSKAGSLDEAFFELTN